MKSRWISSPRLCLLSIFFIGLIATVDCANQTSTSEWGSWSSWSECSVSCGGNGTTKRTRECPTYGGCKPGLSTEEKSCGESACEAQWGQWSEWTKCSITCGSGGQQLRSRQCSTYGGLCKGDKTESKDCQTPPCAVWSSWGDWGSCSVTCGTGTQQRSRECSGYGAKCLGEKTETKDCAGPPCCTPWTDWGSCSQTCAGGTQKRTQTCGATDKNSTNYVSGTSKEESQSCNSFSCPVWTSWSSWSDCSVSCTSGYGKSGTHSATRECKIDTAYCKGYNEKNPACNCTGSASKTESCNTFSCPKWAEWTGWGECSVSCSSGYGKGGTHERNRECKVDTGYCTGYNAKSPVCNCSGNARESESCNTFSCPKWSEWSSWTSCSKSCAVGARSKSRSCKTDTSYCTGDKLSGPVCKCEGNDKDQENCNTFDCPIWSNWGSWGDCSLSCKTTSGPTGVHIRKRACKTDQSRCGNGRKDNNAYVTTASPNSKSDASNSLRVARGIHDTDDPCVCQGSDSDSESCNNFICPYYSEWSSWGSCSASCGGGSQTQTRECIIDKTYCAGEKVTYTSAVCKCPGVPSQSQRCNTFSCPVWSEWGAWGDCSISCKSPNGPDGVHVKRRTCKIDESRCSGGKTPVIDILKVKGYTNSSIAEIRAAAKDRIVRQSSYGDPCVCPGSDSASEGCNNISCPFYSDWGVWSDCSATCGGGNHYQTRNCITDKIYCSPARIGNEPVCKCVGVAKQEEQCNIYSCPSWSVWAGWSGCTKSCATGERTNTRTCQTDGKFCTGGANSGHNACKCVGAPKTSETCNAFDCPIWTAWSSWSACSKTCASGQQTQTRDCKVDAQLCAADNLKLPVCRCEGLASNSQPCNIFTCPVWAEWSSWSQCTTSCTGLDGRSGSHTQSRGCQIDKNYCIADNLGTPACKCQGESVTAGPCNQWSCPIWAEWSSWGDCSLSCSVGNNIGGIHSRKRICKVDTNHCATGANLLPNRRNRRQVDPVCQCPGNDTSVESCNKVVCPVFTEWGAWASCSVTCGGGKHVQTRDCKVDTDYCLNERLNTEPVCKCLGSLSQSGDCNIFSCPVWAEWANWGQCSSSCKPLNGIAGLHVRTRLCQTDANRCASNNGLNPQVNSASLQSLVPLRSDNTKLANNKRTARQIQADNPCVCAGNDTSSEICNDFVCPYYSEWSGWGSCSASCGGGTHSQTRICNTDKLYCTNERVGTDPICTCTGVATQSEQCNTFSCPVWAEWAAWGDCTLSCKAGNGPAGTHLRKRVCSIDASRCSGGARTSVNPLFISNDNVKLSPAKPNPLNPNNNRLTSRLRRRKRQVSNDPCVCPGSDSDSEICNNFNCPLWSEWGGWGDCSISCRANGGAAGVHTKTRNCVTDTTRCAGGGTGITSVAGQLTAGRITNTSRNVRLSDNFHPANSPLNPNNFGRFQRQVVSTNDPCACPGSNSASESCNDIVCPVFSEWSAWGSCSVTCGGGDHTQTRNCLTDKIYCTNDRLNDPVCKCNGLTTQSERCNTFTCPAWGEWGSWGSCSISCKATATATAGTHSRSRPCLTDPTRCSNGGGVTSGSLISSGNGTGLLTPQARTLINQRRTQRQVSEAACTCPGTNSNSEPCNNIVCASFSEWGAFGVCSAQCGGGTHSSSRTCLTDTTYCTNERVQSDPVCKCTGDLTRSENCNTFACAAWSEWGSWGQCSASCVAQNGQVGVHTKQRACKVDPTRCPNGGKGTERSGGTVLATGGGTFVGTGGTGVTVTNNGGSVVSSGGTSGGNGGGTFTTGGNGGGTVVSSGGTATSGGNGGGTVVSSGGTATSGGNGFGTIVPAGRTSGTSSGGTFTTGGNGGGTLIPSGSIEGGTLPAVGNGGGSLVPSSGFPAFSTGGGPLIGPTLSVVNTSRFQSVRRSDSKLISKDSIATADNQRSRISAAGGRPFNSLNPNNIRRFTDLLLDQHSRSVRQVVETLDPCVCPGSDSLSESCNNFKCSFFSEWGAWGSCSVTCGSGNRTQPRNCVTDQVYCTQDRLNSDPVCRCTGPTVQSGICTSDPCPTFSQWTAWGSCSVTCGNGTNIRTRSCSRSDAPCIGLANDSQSCFAAPCYTWNPWESWSGDCQFILCGGGSINRTRKCPVEGACPGLAAESSICNQQPCPDWGQWAEWSGCSVSCGSGGRVRTRSCPLKDSCKPGTPFQVDPVKCSTQACPSWTEWTPWGECSASCGVGNRRRNRTCSLQDGCPGRTEDVDPCSATPCPPVIPLSPWSECSKTCGGGIKTRSKTACAEGPPACPIESETSPCNEQICPLWEAWGVWGDCSRTCGSGQRSRKRGCAILNGCVGQGEEIDPLPCNAIGCPTGRLRSRSRRAEM